MKHLLKGIASLGIALSLATAAHSSKIPIGPDMSYGAGGSFGIYNAIAVKGDDMKYRPDFGYQGGLIAEKMFSNRFGLHTGLWFTFGFISFDMKNSDGSTTEADFKFISLSIPALSIISFNSKKISLNLLSGFTLTHILSSEMIFDDSSGVEQSSDVLHYMNYVNISVTAGLNLKFRITQFSDLFIGVLGDFNCLEMIRDKHGDDMSYIYSGRVISGVLFRTDIFPMMRRK